MYDGGSLSSHPLIHFINAPMHPLILPTAHKNTLTRPPTHPPTTQDLWVP